MIWQSKYPFHNCVITLLMRYMNILSHTTHTLPVEAPSNIQAFTLSPDGTILIAVDTGILLALCIHFLMHSFIYFVLPPFPFFHSSPSFVPSSFVLPFIPLFTSPLHSPSAKKKSTEGNAVFVNYMRQCVLDNFRFHAKPRAIKFSPDGKYPL